MIVHHAGHSFDPRLVCRCGVSWDAHQLDLQPCTEPRHANGSAGGKISAKRTHITEDEITEMVRLRAKGYTYQEITLEVGRSFQGTRAAIKRAERREAETT